MGRTFTRPPTFRKGEVILASKLEMLSRGILELQNTVNPISSGQITARTPPPFWTSIGGETPSFTVAVTTGYLTYQSNTPNGQESEQGPTGWIAPKLINEDGDLVSIEPPSPPGDTPFTPPKLALPGVKSYVYLRAKTDSDGCPKFEDDEVTIEAFEEIQESIHHHRPNPASGEEEGDYYFLILETEGDGGSPEKPRVVRRITGNREMPNQLVEIANLGDKRELYKGYLKEEDKHEFRTIEQIEGEGVEIIEPLDPGKDAEDPVVVDGVIVTPGTPAVPPEKEGDTIKWRRIDGRTSTSESDNGSSKQIEVREREGLEEDADGRKRKVIEVVGNDFTEGHTDVKRFSISFDDGLVTSFLKIDDEEGDGWWGTVQWVDLATSGQILLTFKAGKLVEVFSGLYGVGVTQPGTEAAPGVVSLTF